MRTHLTAVEPLAKSNTGSPRFTDFPSLCACSESSLTDPIGSGLNLLCFQSHSKTECRWTRPEVAILGADQKERGLWGREWRNIRSICMWAFCLRMREMNGIFEFGAICLNAYALRRVFKWVIYVARKILSREMKDYNKFTHISNTVDMHFVCRDFG